MEEFNHNIKIAKDVHDYHINSSNFLAAAQFKKVLFVDEDTISRAETNFPNDDIKLVQTSSPSDDKEYTATTQGANNEDDICVVNS